MEGDSNLFDISNTFWLEGNIKELNLHDNSKPFRHKGKRSWSAEEDAQLLKLVEQHGGVNWAIIAHGLIDRTGKQCRERYHNHLQPNVKKGDWTEEEDMIILSMQSMLGNQWAKISKMLPGRPDNDVKNRWHSIFPNICNRAHLLMPAVLNNPALKLEQHSKASGQAVDVTVPRQLEDLKSKAIPQTAASDNTGGLLLQMQRPCYSHLSNPFTSCIVSGYDNNNKTNPRKRPRVGVKNTPGDKRANTAADKAEMCVSHTEDFHVRLSSWTTMDLDTVSGRSWDILETTEHLEETETLAAVIEKDIDMFTSTSTESLSQGMSGSPGALRPEHSLPPACAEAVTKVQTSHKRQLSHVVVAEQ